MYIRIEGIKGAEGTVSDQFALIIPKVPSNKNGLERGSNYGEDINIQEFNVQFLKGILEPPQSAFPPHLESWKSNRAKKGTQSQSLVCRNIHYLTERKADFLLVSSCPVSPGRSPSGKMG